MTTFGELFAGVGGFSIGLENAGWTCSWQVEWDEKCQQVLQYKWPQVPKWWDVSEVSGADLPPVDVITFGSPCQDLSAAGKRKGLEGSRSGLFFEATRIIKEMRDATANTFPRIAIWENVAGAFTSTGGDDFEAVLLELADIGSCHIEWHCLDAQFFGVPQRRRRVFVIAVLDPAIADGSGRPLLAVGEGRRGNHKKSRQTSKRSAGAAKEGPGESNNFPDSVIAFSHTQGLSAQASTIASPTLRSKGCGMAVALSPVIAFDGYNQSASEDIYRSLRTGIDSGDHVQIPKENGEMLVRRLTPVECERLMGWPDNHTLNRADGKKNADSIRFKICGNGVASPVAQWIGEQLNVSIQTAQSPSPSGG